MVHAGAPLVLSSDDFDLPDDIDSVKVPVFKPLEVTSTAEEDDFASVELGEGNYGVSFAPLICMVADTSGLQVKSIPAALNRPLRVGIFIGAKEIYLKQDGEEFAVTAAGSQIVLRGSAGKSTYASHEFANSNGRCVAVSDTRKNLAQACYPGKVLVRANSGKVDVINFVDIEDYLRGVVPFEIGRLDASRIEALKAQAVAARTYAYKHFGSRESMGFDVFADTKDQVYKGLEGATNLTDKAIQETAGVVMTYKGEFITAYYHSTCGGQTETLDTWEKPSLPYLQSLPDMRPDGTPWCSESSYMSWVRKFTDKELPGLVKQNLKEARATFSPAKAANFSSISSITVKDRLEGGRIKTLLVQTDAGTIEVHADKTRWLFKNSKGILPSSAFGVKHQGNEWIVTGTGFGHGVGMCQMGVRARAHAGQGYKEILEHYYTGVTLERYVR